MALDRYKYSHIELISALYGRDYVFKTPGICNEIDIMYSRICLLSHAPRVQSGMHVWTSTYEVIPSVFGNIRLWCMRNFIIVAFIGVSIYWDIHIGAA